MLGFRICKGVDWAGFVFFGYVGRRVGIVYISVR